MRYLLSFLCLLWVMGAQGQPSRTECDSLMEVAQALRDVGAWQQAVSTYYLVPTAEARVLRAETLLEGGDVGGALSLATALYKDKLFALRPEARLVMARCYLAQGRPLLAERVFGQLCNAHHAEAEYRYAEWQYSRGDMPATSTYARRAIDHNAALAPAHLLLAQAEAQRRHRYQALMPLLYYMLTASDAGREAATPLLRRLLSPRTLVLDPLGLRTPETALSEALEADLRGIATDQALADADTLTDVANRLGALGEAVRQRGEEALDWWQLRYGDVLVELSSRGMLPAAARHILGPAHKAEALAWVDTHADEWGRFAVWLEAHVATR